jgi:hypothetical protein
MLRRTAQFVTRQRLSLGVEKFLHSSAPLGLCCVDYDLILIRLPDYTERVGQ